MMKDIIKDGAIFDKRRFLFEQGYRDVLVDPDGTGIARLFTGEDAEQRGFTAAVSGDQGDLIAFFDMKSNIPEKRFYAIGFTQIRDRNIVHPANVRE
jgi:hypothetical protein